MARGVNIAALAKRTGVAADTLRKWEERYGVLRPTRTSGGQRRYSDLDVARVEWLSARLEEGYRIGEAAALLGAAEIAPPKTPAELAQRLFEACSERDQETLEHLLDHAFALFPLETALCEAIVPLVRRVGDAWASGQLSVADEHLVSGVIHARLERLLSEPRAAVRGSTVLACAPGERHELGLLMLATLLRTDGWQVGFLGADTPVGDALELASRLGARSLCISVAMADRLPALEAGFRDADRPRGLKLVAGGAAMTAELARDLGARYVDGDVRRAVRELRKLGR